MNVGNVKVNDTQFRFKTNLNNSINLPDYLQSFVNFLRYKDTSSFTFCVTFYVDVTCFTSCVTSYVCVTFDLHFRPEHVHANRTPTGTHGSGRRSEDSAFEEGLRKYDESCRLQTPASLQDQEVFPLQQSAVPAGHLQVNDKLLCAILTCGLSCK